MGKLRLAFVLAALSALAGTLAGRAARPDPVPDSFGCGGGGFDCDNFGGDNCGIQAPVLFTGPGNAKLASVDGPGVIWYAWKSNKDSGVTFYSFIDFRAGMTFEVFSDCAGTRLAAGTIAPGQNIVTLGPTVAILNATYFIKITGAGNQMCGKVTVIE